jgi:peptide/nickel transport system ATP-binding protein
VIFVTHDIGVATEIADRIAVMYAGRIVETGSCRAVIRAAAHPYTKGLLASRADQSFDRGNRLQAIPGAPPDLSRPFSGCAFAPRCREAREECRVTLPDEIAVAPGHAARCVLLRHGEIAATAT